MQSECRTKGIELKLVIGSSLARLGSRARVFADPGSPASAQTPSSPLTDAVLTARLTQIIVNLLSNAIRFTAKSQVRIVTVRVEVSAVPPEPNAPLIPPHETEYHIEEKRPIHLFFSVEDTGPGMTEEETSRLFAKFMQCAVLCLFISTPLLTLLLTYVEPRLSHTRPGADRASACGSLAVRSAPSSRVRSSADLRRLDLCELQGGRIEVASTVGKGSIFRCFITARSVEAGPTSSDSALAVVEGITGPNADRDQTPKVLLRQGDKDEKPLSGMTVLCCEVHFALTCPLRVRLDAFRTPRRTTRSTGLSCGDSCRRKAVRRSCSPSTAGKVSTS